MKPAELLIKKDDYLLRVDGFFNPILHESPDFARIDNREIQFTRQCHCDKPYSLDYFYPGNKKYCKYCVLQRQKLRNEGKLPKAKVGRPKLESVCKCGVTGDENFYWWEQSNGVLKRNSHCKKCRSKKHIQKRFK